MLWNKINKQNGVKIASVGIWDKILKRHFRNSLIKKGHLKEDLKERREGAMQVPGRVFQAEEIANANALRHECTWKNQETSVTGMDKQK